jgi:hypothetical protein
MSEETQTAEEVMLISKHDFYFETPLYEIVDLNLLEDNTFSGVVDAYSAKNSTDTTYAVSSKGIDTWPEWNGSSHISVGFYLVTLNCRRKDDDTLRFVVYRNAVKSIAVKVGQWPSLADLQFAEIGKKYDKVLPEEDLRNLKKAIGLAAHDAGAGSFVYLRRIFENLIQKTLDSADGVEITQANFKNTRMDDKVELLKDFLPSQLVEMKSIYGILSKGVHELTEEECRRYFAPLKLSIELILDQKIEEKKKQDKDAEVKKQLQAITKELGSNK